MPCRGRRCDGVLTALVVSQAMLWGVVLLLCIVLLALVRQIGILHERISPAGALVPRQELRVGDPAPRLVLPDWNGKEVTVGGPSADGRSVLLAFVAPACPVCKTILPILESVVAGEGSTVRLVLAGDGAREEHEEFVRIHGLASRTYLLSTELGLAFRVPRLPWAVLIDASGRIRAQGLVNTREHVESLFEAMERGVGSVQEFLQRERLVPSGTATPGAREEGA